MDQVQSKMPVLFVGHGSPMNIIAENSYTQSLNSLGQRLPRPKAILSISAHWLTRGTHITYTENPKTIYDFYGFPEELYKIKYDAPGSMKLSEEIKKTISDIDIKLDADGWGLDHGTWAVLYHMYPKADIPVLQLSMDMTKPPQFHFELGKKLQFLREKNVLILASGNVVHNLRKIKWEEDAPPFDWSVQFNNWIKEKIKSRNEQEIMDDYLSFEAGKLSVPTPDHYYPLLYTMGATDKTESVKFEFDEIQNGSVSMLSVSFGF